MIKGHIHLWNVVFDLFVPHTVLQIWYIEVRIYWSISECPLHFAITRVDCACIIDPNVSEMLYCFKSSAVHSDIKVGHIWMVYQSIWVRHPFYLHNLFVFNGLRFIKNVQEITELQDLIFLIQLYPNMSTYVMLHKLWQFTWQWFTFGRSGI